MDAEEEGDADGEREAARCRALARYVAIITEFRDELWLDFSRRALIESLAEFSGCRSDHRRKVAFASGDGAAD
jgi:hypothetical protein